MSWLGQNGASREDFYALADAYKAVYNKQELQEDPETIEEADKKGDSVQADAGGTAEWRATENTADPDAGPGGAPNVSKNDSPSVKKQLDDAGKRKGPDGGQKAKMKEILKNKPGAYEAWLKKVMTEEDVLDGLAAAYAMMYEKKKDSDKCGDDTYWDKEEKKCKSKKKKSGTTVVVGRGGIYGPGYHGGGGGSNGDGDGDGDGGDSGGGDGGGGGGE